MKQHATSVRPTQIWPENYRRGPVAHARTTRTDQVSVVTSGYGGKLLPIKMIPLLREDGISTSRLAINVQMAETADMLLNPVRVSAMAYLVPKLAFERFKDMGTIDRSYNGQPEVDASVVPWFETFTYNEPPPGQTPDPGVFKTLGLHAPDLATINSDYVEAYNAVWNYIALERSSSLTPRDRLDTTLGPAFWEHTQMRHVVPTFDSAMVEGEIPVSIADGGKMPVKGLYAQMAPNQNAGNGEYDWQGNPMDGTVWATAPSSSNGEVRMKTTGPDAETRVLDVYTELQAEGISLSLASIDQARKTQAWAKLRNQYQGMSDDWMIDQLLAGIRLNDETLKQPILLDHSDTIVGMSERYATDGANLDKSVADGRTSLSLNLRAPALQTGGVVVVCAQVLPEMIYERQRDYYMRATNVSELPLRTADELDPQPVETIKNGEVDESHSLPNDLFGYAPLNHRWMRRAPNVGGKYYRPDPAAIWNENRNRIWSTEVVDPTLGPDFYISNSVSHEVFADQNTDPFEFWCAGDVQITGNTFFGEQLREAQGDYDAVAAQVPTDRLAGDGTDT